MKTTNHGHRPGLRKPTLSQVESQGDASKGIDETCSPGSDDDNPTTVRGILKTREVISQTMAKMKSRHPESQQGKIPAASPRREPQRLPSSPAMDQTTSATQTRKERNGWKMWFISGQLNIERAQSRVAC